MERRLGNRRELGQKRRGRRPLPHLLERREQLELALFLRLGFDVSLLFRRVPVDAHEDPRRVALELDRALRRLDLGSLQPAQDPSDRRGAVGRTPRVD